MSALNATLLALALLLAWDASGLDLVVAGWFGNVHGFPLRDSWWASGLLHDGGRLLAWTLLLAMVVQLWRAPLQATAAATAKATGRSVPTRRQRAGWLGVMLLCAVAVPLLKRFSSTSCPWDLADFGGLARYVSHWQPGVADGGSGHCFPSGHAVSAFAFFGMVFLWLPHNRARAWCWLAGVLAAGAVFGTAQLLRGAHYPSHTLWSGWLCWTLCVAARALAARRSTMPAAAAGAVDDRIFPIQFDESDGFDRPDPGARPLET